MSFQEMSGAAKYDERGGFFQPAVHASSDTMNSSSGEARSNPTTSTITSITEHDFRFPRRPVDVKQWEEGSATKSATSQSSTSHTNTRDSGGSPLDKLDLSGAANNARKELLRESFFPTWKDDTAGRELDSPDEMQKKDPLATQIWRLYSKTKKQLPNQERMENLTWRMMAMSLRKRKQEEAARYVLNEIIHCGSYIVSNDSWQIIEAAEQYKCPQRNRSVEEDFRSDSGSYGGEPRCNEPR